MNNFLFRLKRSRFGTVVFAAAVLLLLALIAVNYLLLPLLPATFPPSIRAATP